MSPLRIQFLGIALNYLSIRTILAPFYLLSCFIIVFQCIWWSSNMYLNFQRDINILYNLTYHLNGTEMVMFRCSSVFYRYEMGKLSSEAWMECFICLYSLSQPLIRSFTNLTVTFENLNFEKDVIIKLTNLYAVNPVQNGTWIKWKSTLIRNLCFIYRI
jgi:hypothetical protein